MVFGGFEGESYADIPTVRANGGPGAAGHAAARLAEMKEIADFARLLGVDAVGLHVGFVPHDDGRSAARRIVAPSPASCATTARPTGRTCTWRPGQEAADALLDFLAEVGRDNLFVNFDPANMILYGSGEPIEALRKVGRYVRSVHCKDAKWAARPGQEWGAEVPLGEGDVGMENFLRTLDDLGYTGPLTIEREIPQEPSRQKEEIGRGIRLLNELKAKIG